MIFYDVVVLTLNKKIPAAKVLSTFLQFPSSKHLQSVRLFIAFVKSMTYPSGRALGRYVLSFIYLCAGRFRRTAARRRPVFTNVSNYLVEHVSQNRCRITQENNSIEGQHRRFNAQVSSYHPLFWKFLDSLKREESLTRVPTLQCFGRHALQPYRQRYVDSNGGILRIVDDNPNHEPINYLESIAHNLSYQEY